MQLAVVADLCTALGEYIDEDPKGAAKVTKKLGEVLLRHHELEEARTAEWSEAEKLREGRGHELQQRELDLREVQLQNEGERVKVALAKVAARAAK